MHIHIHVRVHRWVFWWFTVGVILGAVGIINILFRDLSRAQDRIILAIGAVNWLLGGLICYGYGGMGIERSSRPPGTGDSLTGSREEYQKKYWHPASDFVLPGDHKSLLPPKY